MIIIEVVSLTIMGTGSCNFLDTWHHKSIVPQLLKPSGIRIAGKYVDLSTNFPNFLPGRPPLAPYHHGEQSTGRQRTFTVVSKLKVHFSPRPAPLSRGPSQPPLIPNFASMVALLLKLTDIYNSC